MLKLVSLVPLASGLLDGLAESTWKDEFGWTCRDYGRLPKACDLITAVNAEGVHVDDACFACSERRRQTVIDRECSDRCTNTHSGCNRICSSQLDTCTQTCDGDLSRCQNSCETDNTVEESTIRPYIDDFEPEVDRWWIWLLIPLVLLCCLCLALPLLYMLCRPSEQGDCSQAEMSTCSQPMMIQPQAAPCAMAAEPACDSGCEQPAAGYAQGGGGYEQANQGYGY